MRLLTHNRRTSYGIGLLWAVVVGIMFLFAVHYLAPVTDAERKLHSPPTTIHLQEDDPGWDCHTMGDGRCGR